MMNPGFDYYRVIVAVVVHILIVFMLLNIGQYGTHVVIRHIYIYIVVNLDCKIKMVSHQPPFQWIRDNSVGIATRYGLDGPGIESRWGGEILRTRPGRPWGPPSLLYNCYRIFPGDKAAGAWR